MRNRFFGSLVLLAATLAVEAGTIEMKVYGLVCAFCAQGIEKTLRQNPATADVLVSLEHKLVAVRTREGEDIADEALHRAITDAGYDLKAIERTGRSLAEIRASLRNAHP
jgi:mercuric ion binding protein